MTDETSSSSEAADAEAPKKRGRPRKVVDEKAKKAIGELVKGWKWKGRETPKRKAPARKRAPRKRAEAPAEDYAPRGSDEAVLGILVHAGLVTEEQVAAARELAS